MSLSSQYNEPKTVALNLEERSYLRRIGLSIQEVHLYELLLEKGRLSAQGAATYTGNFPSAEYRLFYELEKHRLVRRLSGRPMFFEAVTPEVGIKASLQANDRELRALISHTLNKPQASDELEIIIGRQALYDAYMRNAVAAKHEICLYSIGIAFSNSLESTQKAAIKRGVSVKHVIQQRSLSNQHVIAKWQRIGVRLRYLKQSRGFHFFVIDRRVVCITFSDPVDTDNRLSIRTDNSAVVQLFIKYFQDIWSQARTLDP